MEAHQILGVSPHATVQEIRHAFRNLAKRCHPDTSGYDSAGHFRLVQEAYEKLMASSSRCNAQAQAAPPPQPTHTPWGTPYSRPKPSWSAEDEKRWRERHPEKTPEEKAAEEKAARKREKAQAAYARRKKAAANAPWRVGDRFTDERGNSVVIPAVPDRWNIGDRFTDENGQVFVKTGRYWEQVI